MKIRSELKAGGALEDCGNELSWWQNQVGLMQQYVNSSTTTPPAGLWTPTGTAVQLPSFINTSGNHDMSGICG